MCVCVCVCVCVCMFVSRVCTYMCMYVHVCVCVCVQGVGRRGIQARGTGARGARMATWFAPQRSRPLSRHCWYERESARLARIAGIVFTCVCVCVYVCAGNGFCFLTLYRVFRDEIWLRRAHAFAQSILVHFFLFLVHFFSDAAPCILR